MATRSAVAASRSRLTSLTRSGAGAVVAQDLVQLSLVVALPLAQALDDEHARHEELSPRVLSPPTGPDGDAPGRHDAARDLLTRLGVDDRDGRIEEAAGAQHRPLADARPARDHATAPDEGVVLHHHRDRVGRLEHAPDPDPAGH